MFDWLTDRMCVIHYWTWKQKWKSGLLKYMKPTCMYIVHESEPILSIRTIYYMYNNSDVSFMCASRSTTHESLTTVESEKQLFHLHVCEVKVHVHVGYFSKIK